jgi:acyl-coenzyme A thioesterase PaaI-like protein
MPKADNCLIELREVNPLAKFNNWLGVQVVSASDGKAEFRMSWREEFGQYAGYLHA